MMTLLFSLMVAVFSFWLSFAGAFTYGFCATKVPTEQSEFCQAYTRSFDAAKAK